MDLKYERDFDSASTPGFRFIVKRLSLSDRIRFLADNHELMQRVKFHSAASSPDTEARLLLADLELELSRRLLEKCLMAISTGVDFKPAHSEVIDWLLRTAPTELCVEVLSRVSDEISLSGQRRKNWQPPSNTSLPGPGGSAAHAGTAEWKPPGRAAS